MAATSADDKQARRQRFLDVFPGLVDDLLDYMRGEKMPVEAVEWYRRNLEANTPGGKLNRGLSVVDTTEILLCTGPDGKRSGQLTDEQYHKAAILGWCVELLQAYFLVADDMMDQSITRRGQPCWYRVKEVGNIAINDAFMLEAAIYHLLKKYFRSHPAYGLLMELFLETTFQTELGQLIDLITAPEDHVDLDKFSLEKHHLIVVYKTAYYSFYLPVALAMRYVGITDEALYKQALDILLPLGEYFQVQDDYLDCYGDPEVIGKIGTDIQDNKCSWLINYAKSVCSAEQLSVLKSSYGRKNDAAAEARVKDVFNELHVAQAYEKYEKDRYDEIMGKIGQLQEGEGDGKVPGMRKEVFVSFVEKVYKRSK